MKSDDDDEPTDPRFEIPPEELERLRRWRQANPEKAMDPYAAPACDPYARPPRR